MAKHRARPSGHGPQAGISRWQRAGEGTATLLKVLYWMAMLVNILTGIAGGGPT
ncbi:hypothetical protein GA0070216_11193 [Micromonospora matsumotoense]|uniref:Uncharacterized protein n=1 Tax=Micromonospora matsumotoense TaxID=121616 RepID=A0A1C4ZU87_9ACTN|nr:hypothetical protein GA0070216_11193 [Micromonospora matsumotoense]